jgi:hypothetical protein
MTRLDKRLISVAFAAAVLAAIVGAYRWSNTPPKRPKGVSADAAFLWTGHLGLPAPRHGTWIECWADTGSSIDKCKLTEMDGTLEYEGTFLADTGKNLVPQPELKILSEQTSQSTDLWVRVKQHLVPIVFLQNGTVLIPKDAYQDGMTKLEHLREIQRK